jgi:hypothetical protein
MLIGEETVWPNGPIFFTNHVMHCPANWYPTQKVKFLVNKVRNFKMLVFLCVLVLVVLCCNLRQRQSAYVAHATIHTQYCMNTLKL